MPFYQPVHHERGFAHIIIVLVILVVGVVIGLYLVQNPQIFRPQASSDATLCQASDPASFGDCLARAQSNETIDKIEVTNQITCTRKEECSFSLLKRTKPLTIFGTPNTGAGFKRVNNYDYPLLVFGTIGESDFSKISEIRDLTLKNLIFDETTASCDFTKKGMGQCNTPLVLAPKLINPVIDGITILHAKAHGMQIKGVFNLVIKNSKIIDSEGDGLWFDSGYPDNCTVDLSNYKICPLDTNKISTVVQIENNLFAENKIAGVELFANGYEQFPNSVKGNLFIHNHRDAKYEVCNGHCPGGQLVIARTKHLLIEENVIRDGKIDSVDPVKGNTYHQQGLLASGIELGDTLENITIKNNKIYNNSGAAVFADYVGTQYGVSNINIFWNMVYGNSLRFGGAGYADLEKAPGFAGINNIGERADVSFREAFIFADPPVCVPSTENGQCLSTIHWYTNDHAKVNVRISGNADAIVASGPNGKQEVPWISAGGVNFALENPDSKQIIDSTFAKAFSTTTAPITTPLPVQTPLPITETPKPVVTPIPATPSPMPAPATPSPAPRKMSILKAEPNTCVIQPGASLCTIKISWNASAYPEQIAAGEPILISIKENPGSVFANGVSGSQDAPWIGTVGATFDAYYKGKLIDSLYVKGTNP